MRQHFTVSSILFQILMNVLKANIIALYMPDAKNHLKDTVVNVSLDLREMERLVHVR